MFDLSTRTALVTGGGQFIGAGIATALAAQGAHVFVNDIVAERAAEVASAIGGTAAPFDVTDRDAVTAAVADIGPVDIVVNNAGNGGAAGMRPTPFAEMDPSDWDAPLEVNLRGVMHTTHAVLGGMIERGWGRLITISSGAGSVGVGIGVAPYSAGKGGALGFMRSIALEVAASGVTSNSIALGLMANVSGDTTSGLARSIPTKRLGTPEDIAAACVYLASPEASWVTGQTLNVNGGSFTS